MMVHKNKMLRLITGLVLVFVIETVSADEAALVWSRIYSRAKTVNQKHQILLSMIELDDRELIPVFIEALDELTREKSKSSLIEDMVMNEVRRFLVKELGDLRAARAAGLIYKIINETEHVLLKSEAIIALGKTGQKNYAPKIAQVLRNLNTIRGAHSSDEEKIAFGCLTALSWMRDPSGYEPVFFATFAGYSGKIQDLAKRILPDIVDDPTDILVDLLRMEADPKVKLLCLNGADVSRALPGNKLRVAEEALNEGLIISAKDPVTIASFMNLRKKALRMFSLLENGSQEVIPQIEKVLYLDTDLEEKLYAVGALKTFSNDASTEVLANLLGYYNTRREAGIIVRADRLLIATIQALGHSKNRIGYEELVRVKFVGHSANVEREADKALKALSGR